MILHLNMLIDNLCDTKFKNMAIIYLTANSGIS